MSLPKMNLLRPRKAIFAFGLFVWMLNSAGAATFTWLQISGGNASGSWANQANWTGATLPTTTNDTLDFSTLDLTADSTITLNGNQSIGSLSFGDANTATAASWLINAGSPASSALTLGGAATINVTSFAGGDAAVINVPISGTNGLTKSGTAFLQLNATNTYTGGTILSGSDCRFSIGNSKALSTGTAIIGATAGAGQVWFNAAGALTLTNAFEVRSIRWIIDSTTINGVAAGDLTVNGNVLLNNGSSNVRDIYPNGRNLIINGNVSVASSVNPLNKNGGSTLTLNGSNFVQAASAVNAGTLIVNGPMNGGATFTVNSGATLRGTGVFSGPISVASGGAVRPNADGSGTLTCGGLTMASGAALTLGFAAPGASTNGRVVVNGNLTLAGTINIADLGGYTNGSYTALTYTGAFVNNGVTIVGAPAGQSVVVDATTPGSVLLRTLNGSLYPAAAESIPMSLASSLSLEWIEMVGATNYDVFLGTISNSVFNATSNTAGIYLGRTNSFTFGVTNLQPNTTYFWRVDGVAANGAVTKGAVYSFTTGAAMVDLMQDTWVATDALNRTLPGFAECGAPRSDRPIGIFYFLWHTTNGLGTDGPRDNTKVINALGGYTDKLNPWADNPGWMSGSSGRSWYWGEPEYSYYANDDEWVIRRHIMLLEAAGVDVLGFDTTNGNPAGHAPKYLRIMAVIRKMQMEGIPVRLKIFHYTHGGAGGSPATMTWLYDNFYKPGLYRDLWFYWQGKPLIIGYPDGLSGDGSTPVSAEIRNYFTMKTGWAYVSTTLSNEWQWIDTPTRQNFGYSGRTDIAEQLPVTCGGWANGNLGRSYQNGTQPGFDNFHLTTNRTEGQGIQFSEQAFQAQKVDPQFLWITGWNEWWAGSWDATSSCFTHLLTMCVSPPNRYFVDNYNAEYSRDIEPMKGGFTDNYYFQMVGNNRQRKGVRPVPSASAPKTVNLAGDFSDWSDVGPSFWDYVGEVIPRNWPTTFGNLPNNTDNTGRNDFRLLKVARDANTIYFYAQCSNNISSYTDANWMTLFLNVDRSRSTGWEGYDFAVNLGARTASTTTLSQNSGTNWSWTTVRSDIAYKVTGNQLMLAIPRAALGLTNEPFSLDFHWSDNFQTNDIAGFFLYGDTAPERRFNYRYQTVATVTNVLRADNFDSGKQSFWDESWTNGSKWSVASAGSYSGSCAIASTTNGTSQQMLVTRVDTSALESFRVSFRFKFQNVGDAQNLNLEYYNGSNWLTMRDVGRDQYYPSGQAWSYDERTNVWMLCVDARSRSGTNSQFFSTNFAVRINASGLTTASQAVSVDDFLITGVTLVTNTPPVITVISNRTVVAGVTINFTNIATDPDLPGQTLTWSLIAAPTNATLATNTGVFNWRPLIAQAPSTNLVSLMVADNGSPSLTATQTFSIKVSAPQLPQLIAPSLLAGNRFQMSISGNVGPDYFVQSSSNLLNWSTVFFTNPPLLPFQFIDGISNGDAKKFYRVLLGP
jgi:hypothetical protein